MSRETPGQADARLRRVIAAADLVVEEGTWWFEEFPLAQWPARVRPDAVALVRDDQCWSQLVPARPGDRPAEPLRLWSFHFPDDLDNSGFVGWLASRIKRRIGSGVLVVCGRNGGRGGVYDYWACPLPVADTVLALVRSLAAGRESGRAAGAVSLDGVRMRVARTAEAGAIGRDTVFEFEQDGSVVSARYAGGAVRLGHLVGTIAEGRLVFRYAQLDQERRVHGGYSVCDVATLPDGRLRIEEHFAWDSREGSGTNVLEEMRD